MPFIKIYCFDVIYFLKRIIQKYGENSVALIFADPPYNIGKDSWDFIMNYIDWCGKWLGLCEKVLKDNGSLYLFHNNFRAIRDIDLWIEKNTKFLFKQLIIWNKYFEGCRYSEYLEGYFEMEDQKKYQQMAEYILFYHLDNTYKIKKRREELGISQKIISQEILSKNKNLTGWFSNIELGKNYPTRETIKPIEKYLGLTYDDIVPYFKYQVKKNSVWNYNIADRITEKKSSNKKEKVHLTPKPINLIQDILRNSAKKGDFIINLFSGSGNIEIACRDFEEFDLERVLGCDNKKKYVDFANNRLKSKQVKISGFMN